MTAAAERLKIFWTQRFSVSARVPDCSAVWFIAGVFFRVKVLKKVWGLCPIYWLRKPIIRQCGQGPTLTDDRFLLFYRRLEKVE